MLELKRGEFARDGDLLHLGIACRGVEFSKPEIWQKEYAWAREQGLPFTTHTTFTRPDPAQPRPILAYRDGGFLGPDHLLVHAVHANEEEIPSLADSATPLSVSIWSELRTGMGIPPVVEMMRAGVAINLSLDTMAASDNSDMFAGMRAQMCVERGRHEDATCYQPDQVLRQATIDGATALGLGDVTGSLTPGKRADVILVRTDDLNIGPLNVPDGQIVLAAQPHERRLRLDRRRGEEARRRARRAQRARARHERTRRGGGARLEHRPAGDLTALRPRSEAVDRRVE